MGEENNVSQNDEVRSTSSWDSHSGTVTNESENGTVGHQSTTDESKAGAAVAEEEKYVRRAKCLVGFAFVSCAVAMTVAVYFIAKESDKTSFEIEYEGYIKDIMALVIWEVRYNFALMEQLSASITIATHLRNSSFPFHSDPDFEITGGFVDGMGGIMSAGFAPLIQSNEREDWEQYAWNNQDWIKRSAYLKAVHAVHRDALHGTIQDHEHDRRLSSGSSNHRQLDEETIPSKIFYWEDGERVVEPEESGKVYAPLWQVSPADYGAVNANLLADPRVIELYDVMKKADRAVLSSNFEIGNLFDFLFDPEEKIFKKDPHGFLLLPIHEDFYNKTESKGKTVGILIGVTVFSNILDRLLPEGRDGIIGVLSDTCGNTMSFELSSGKAKFLGYEDVHEEEFEEYDRYQSNLEMYEDPDIDGLCVHDLHIYPTSKFRQTFDSNAPAIYASVVALAFLGTAMLMLFYDCMVNKRQQKTVRVAAQTQAIVTSLFPKNIGRQLVQEAVNEDTNGHKGWMRKSDAEKKKVLDGFVNEEGDDGDLNRGLHTSTKPMADLFPEATVMFGDIVGFTAWASTREPTQVFMLLEGLYSSFDKLALRRKVMKIETVGDCYVAVCGLPDPRKDHATVMVKFARDCLQQMDTVLHNLTISLGPDTTDLGIRIGLNSGPVTAGVLRGDRARFQLFGDTVNTTARIESNGSKNRIHISEETAHLLMSAGKGDWVIPRNTKIHAKGKGVMQTYWVKSSTGTKSVMTSSTADSGSVGSDALSGEYKSAFYKRNLEATRVIEWNVELLATLLKEVIARRRAIGVEPDSRDEVREEERRVLTSRENPLSEVKEVIKLPKYKESQNVTDPKKIKLPPAAMAQLKEYVTSIGKLYNENPFHNFEHANHVTMSVVKLLKRIVAPTNVDGDVQNLHDHTYGITSDPLTQFAVVLSALIHDVDHTGVPNTQLVKDETRAAIMYKGKSVAEQHSVELAWSVLMEDQFECLRRTIYTTKKELRRFRQMVVHTVMATDIMDKEINSNRKSRWCATFRDNPGKEDDDDAVDRKATIVIEHLMQASDVAHTMQHWHVYSKWNGRLFKEMYGAFKEGRMENDPSENWYKGEISFLDFYVIPLAQKLQKCGVFGVFSDEYLNYARQNRKEWEEKGEGIVKGLLEEMNRDLQSNEEHPLKEFTIPLAMPGPTKDDSL